MRVTGTSFAAPFVSATAALLVSRAARRSMSLEAKDISEILRSSASPWLASKNIEGYGTGILDATRALEFLDRRINEKDQSYSEGLSLNKIES